MLELLRGYPFITWLLIFFMISYVYNKVFRTRKLPVLKSAVLYLMLAIGAGMLWFFQMEGLPIVASLAVAIGMMLILRIRYFVQGRREKRSQDQS